MTQPLAANDGALNYNFGASVSLSGDTVVIGAPLSRTLAGRGEVDVTLVVDNKAANTVRINIR